MGLGDNVSNDFTVYPNPFENEFTVDFPENLVGNEFSLIDMMGRTILSSTITEQSTTVDAGELKKGIYTISVTMKNGNRLSKKLIK